MLSTILSAVGLAIACVIAIVFLCLFFAWFTGLALWLLDKINNMWR